MHSCLVCMHIRLYCHCLTSTINMCVLCRKRQSFYPLRQSRAGHVNFWNTAIWLVFHNSENETSRNQEFAFVLPDPLPAQRKGSGVGTRLGYWYKSPYNCLILLTPDPSTIMRRGGAARLLSTSRTLCSYILRFSFSCFWYVVEMELESACGLKTLTCTTRLLLNYRITGYFRGRKLSRISRNFRLFAKILSGSSTTVKIYMVYTFGGHNIFWWLYVLERIFYWWRKMCQNFERLSVFKLKTESDKYCL